jgi:hypothetical protein
MNVRAGRPLLAAPEQAAGSFPVPGHLVCAWRTAEKIRDAARATARLQLGMRYVPVLAELSDCCANQGAPVPVCTAAVRRAGSDEVSPWSQPIQSAYLQAAVFPLVETEQ